MPTRIEREKQTVAQMIKIYCNGRHHSKQLCAECQELLNYAQLRLERCKFGNQKHTCKKCPVHCYKPCMRQKMCAVMRYAGPRMLWHHPIAAIRHMLNH